MEELEDGPGPSSSSKKDRKKEGSKATKDSCVSAVKITLPEQLQKINPAEEFVCVRHRWNTSEEIASILIAFDRHIEWLKEPQKIRPASGSMLLYNRKVVFYRRDGYCWKKRRNGSTIREDHMKLKVQGLECIYGSYVHSAILPTFHRRCYWLLQNPNIVLLHYLNVPYPEAAKPSIISVCSELKQKEWTKEELVDQLRPMLSQVGQNTDEADDNEEKKVERILEELLPMLTPSCDGSTPAVSLSQGQTSQSLNSTHIATLNRIIAPRQSTSQLTPLQQQHQQEEDNRQPKDHQTKTPDTHIALPAFMNNVMSQSSHIGTNHGQITTHSQYQSALFHTTTNRSSLPRLASKPVPNESPIYDINSNSRTTPVSTQQTNDSKANIFSNDSNNFITQRPCIRDHTCQSVPIGTQLRPNDNTMTNNAIINHNPSLTVHSESDAEMIDRTGCSNKDALDSSVVKNHFSSSGLPNRHLHQSPLNPLMHTDINAPSGVAMDVTLQSKNQLVQQPFQASGLFPKGAQVNVQPQQQQNLCQSQQIAQQNHSFELQSLAQNSHQLQAVSQPLNDLTQHQQQQSQNQTPFLTLHLKSANNTSENSGFVLSVQGATIVNQDSSSMLEPSGNQASSFNISNSNGLVLVASQNQSGQLVVNRISNNNHTTNGQVITNTHHNHHQISTTAAAAPGAPFIPTAPPPLPLPPSSSSSCSSQHQESLLKTESASPSSSIFTFNQTFATAPPQPSSDGTTPLGLYQQQNAAGGLSSVATMSHNNALPSLPCSMGPNANQQSAGFTMSIPPPPPKEHQQQQQQHQQHQHQDTTTNVSSFQNILLFPSRENCNTPTSSCLSSGTTLLHHHPNNNAGKDLRKPVVLFNAGPPPTMNNSSLSTREGKDFNNKMELSCPDLDGTQSGQPTAAAAAAYGLMNNTANIFHTDKDMMNNPDSCDTLDGSFSSLPTSDLTLDDLLDLHDLGDLTGSPLGPVDITTTSPSTLPCYWDTNTNQISSSTCSNSTISLSQDHQPHSSRIAAADVMGHKNDHLLHQNHQQQHHPQQHYLSCLPSSVSQPEMAPTSPNHPGAPPRTCTKFTHTTVLTSPPIAPAIFTSASTNVEPSFSHNLVEDPETNAVIKDFAPEWAYSKNNTKVLVAGPWYRKTSVYTCVFDGDHILAVLLQPGLLRCFTPFHNAGYATLQVARDGVIISNCEIFEFCDREKQKAIHPEWFDFDKNNIKVLLIERLDQLQRGLSTPNISFQDVGGDSETLEKSLLERVESLVGHRWSSTDQYPKAGQHNLTLLHLAAALGLAKLISSLIKWRMENSCVALEFEVDALSVDSHSCTPLMWSCSLGHIDAALTLYRWNALPLKICNKEGLLPLSLSRQKGHYNLANQIEQLEKSKEQEENDKLSMASSNLEVFHLNMDITSPPPPPPSSSMALTADADIKREEKEDGEVASIPAPCHSFPKPMTPGPKLIRRFSEQAIGQTKGTLNKRNSVDLLPSGQDIDHAILPTMMSGRDAFSEPHLPVSPDMAFVASPAPRLMLEDKIDEPSCLYPSDPSTSRMDTDETVLVGPGSPIIDVERISSDEEIDDQGKEGSKHQMVTLANQIIAAIPERIKLSPSKGDDLDDSASSGRGRSESHSSLPSQGSPRPSSFGDDSGISTPVTESQAFEEYRYPEFGTPASSLSPESTCLPSPYSPYSFTLDSPPPTTAEFTEYFNAPTTYMEKDFSQLTLSDQEQRKLYEAAKVIQNAYRHYRDKQLQQQKEIEAAVLIQSYYRRYKTYAYYKKMSHAAVLIQNQFRTYYAKRKKRGDSAGTLQGLRRESERLKKGRNQSVIIQQRFRSHYQRRSFDGKEASGSGHGSGEATNRELYQLIQVVRLPSSPSNQLPMPRRLPNNGHC